MIEVEHIHRAWRSLPFGSVKDIIGTGTCVVLAPHPDDESLGCGGLIAACCASGRPPLVAILTNGAASHPNSRAFPPDRLRSVRAAEASTAAGLLGLGASRLLFLGEPDGAASHDGAGFAAVVDTLCRSIRADPACTTILAPWRHDPHCDHEAASLIASAVAKVCGIRHVAFPVWGWTLPPHEAVPDVTGGGWRLDIEAFLPAKRRAIQAHRSQYGRLITDDPTGFQLPATLLSVFENPYETFLET